MIRPHMLHIIITTLIPIALGIPLSERSYSSVDVIKRDVVVIGGGVSGTYAAIRLKDLGSTVAVIEKDEELGGHVQTYITTEGVPVDYGIHSFQNYSVVRDFFERFDIPLTEYTQAGIGNRYADFATGQQVEEGTVAIPEFSAYLAEVAKYPNLRTGWNLPNPVPEDLLLPFGEFVEKYSLQNVAYTIVQLAAGNGNVLEQTTIYVLQLVDSGYLDALFGNGVAAENQNTHKLFKRALADLGSDVMLSSTVSHAKRSNGGVKLVVTTPNGRKLIKAKKLLVTAPPTIENLKPLSLDKKEFKIFSQFENKALYVGLVQGTDLEPEYRYFNADPARKYALPQLPAPQMIWPTRDNGTKWAWYTSPTEKSEDEVKSETIAAIQRLVPGSNPSFVAFDSHTPATVGVTADKIRDGFYDDLLSLQGHKSTWYTGSTWVSDHAAALWNHTEYELLPKLRK